MSKKRNNLPLFINTKKKKKLKKLFSDEGLKNHLKKSKITPTKKGQMCVHKIIKTNYCMPLQHFVKKINAVCK